ncbi:MAG: Rv2993c-like domain-containing protein, partial [Spirochaetales bacterium]
MKIVRFIHEGAERYGIIEGSSVRLATGTPFDLLEPTGITIPLADLKLLSPTRPGKALCIGLNYRDHAVEFGFPIPKTPVVFIKPSTSVIAPSDTILRPAMS